MELFAKLIEKMKFYNQPVNSNRIEQAYLLAKKAHDTQLRKDGSPFVTHPLAVAEITAEMGLDEDSIISAILHDVIEDSDITYEQIAHMFGAAVADMVDGVTKLTRVSYVSKEEQQVENLRKMFLAMSKDIRVLLIKIADRLHNMRTIEYQSEQKRREKALETMEIYAPLAHRLGMQKMKWELEDLSLEYLDPVGYNEITEGLVKRTEEREQFLEDKTEQIKGRLDHMGINATISSRIKHIYSIYRKMYSQNKDINQVYDLYAIRVIVDNIIDCYNVLGIIHDLFKPIPDRKSVV